MIEEVKSQINKKSEFFDMWTTDTGYTRVVLKLYDDSGKTKERYYIDLKDGEIYKAHVSTPEKKTSRIYLSEEDKKFVMEKIKKYEEENQERRHMKIEFELDGIYLEALQKLKEQEKFQYLTDSEFCKLLMDHLLEDRMDEEE